MNKDNLLSDLHEAYTYIMGASNNSPSVERAAELYGYGNALYRLAQSIEEGDYDE
jgi:hypothetical protein